MNCWQTLDIAPTADRRSIKSAYIKCIKQYHPEDHPEKFQEIRAAYEKALQWADGHEEKEEIHRASLVVEKQPAARANIDTALFETTDAQIDASLEEPTEKEIEPTAVSVCLDQIDHLLSADRQQAALAIFRQQISASDSMARRRLFENGLYERLARYQVIPMAFAEAVFTSFGWDIHPDRARADRDTAHGNLHETYIAIRNLKRALNQKRHAGLKVLRSKPRPLRIVFQAFYMQQRSYIQEWIDALLPFECYFGYLGIDPAALSAWRRELQRPQYANDDYVATFFVSLGFACYAAALLPWPFWAKLSMGVLFWVAFGVLMQRLPVFRWAGFKWRDDWRPAASGKIVKSIMDLIPLGIMAFFCALGRFWFDGLNNAGTFGFSVFLIFIIGIRYFTVLATLSAFFLILYLGNNPDKSAMLILFAVFASWLKIKLTIEDNWTVSAKASRRIALIIVAGCCWLVVGLLP